MKEVISDILEQSIKAKQVSVTKNTDLLIKAAENTAKAIAAGNKILLFGNGGSAADSQHIAAEFTNRFAIERPPLAALALTTDTSALTAIGNDYSFDQVFSKQLMALGRPNDIAIGISTSGSSKNVVLAMEAAKDMGLFLISFTGMGGRLAEISDITLNVESPVTARIQETHIVYGHIICDLTDRILYPEKF